MNEEWRDIPGYEGSYQVSKAGEVKSLRAGKILKPQGLQGYLRVSLKLNGRVKYSKIHSLVMLAFVGERPNGLEINHINGVRDDNRIENLEYCTSSQNKRHAIDFLGSHQTGVSARGANNIQAKLNEESVIEIRRLSQSGVPQRALARQFGVSQKAIYQVIHRITWSHVISAGE